MSRSALLKTLAVVGILVAALPTQGVAQNRDRKYEVGIRSGLILGVMELSGLDATFADLEADGLKGAHMSGYFFMYRVRPHLQIGVETLVANSDKSAATTMNYQAAGPVVGLSYGDSWFIAGGVHGGGLIVNAMATQGAAPSQGATTGSFFKGEGGFLAPYLDIGRRFRRHELGVYVKAVSIFGESDRGGLADFSSRFIGVRYSFSL